MSETIFGLPFNVALGGLLIIIVICGIYYTSRKSERVKIFVYGCLFTTAIILLVNLYWLWDNRFIEEYKIDVSKINFHVYNYLFEKNPKKIIHRMSKNDMITFFANTSNFIRDRMEYRISMGDDAVTFADVSEHDKVFSMILLAYRHKTGFYDNLNWREPNQLLYLVNPCYYDPTDTELLKWLKDNIFKDEELMNEIDTPPVGVFDMIMVRFSTVVNSEKYPDKFKIRYLHWVPFYNYQAIAIKSLIEKHLPEKKNCFYNG